LNYYNTYIMMNIPLVIGLTGLARCGKDTFCNYFRSYIKEKEGIDSVRLAFADELKRDVDAFLLEKLNISAFTENTSEKEIIRPFLTTWGTEIMRKKDDLIWVKKLEKKMIQNKKNNIVSIITDIRFPNEINYIHKTGGKIIHLSMDGNKPANDYERKYDPILSKKSDFSVKWQKYGENSLDSCIIHVKEVFSQMGN